VVRHWWWRTGFCTAFVVLALLWVSTAEAQTFGVGVKMPVELSNFTAANMTDNWEVFGRLGVGSFALEMGIFFPLVPLVVSAHGTWALSSMTTEAAEELVFFIGVGGFRIFISDVTFTGFDAKVGLEWAFAGLPLRTILEAGWQSSVEIPLAGAGGLFFSLGVRWDL
jgi:hypothetical protein